LSTLATATAREVFDLLRDDLVAIEQELGRDAASGVSTITEIAEYLREGGGKRIRPTLLLLSAHALGYAGQGAIRLGAVVEMVHTATLVHDDIIDGADTRRGRPSANTAWGNEKCVLAGDWLYMQAFKVALEEKKPARARPADRPDAADGRGRVAADSEAGQSRLRSRVLRPDLPQDRLPVFGFDAVGRGAGRRQRGRREPAWQPMDGRWAWLSRLWTTCST
jgi:hypothetical protein